MAKSGGSEFVQVYLTGGALTDLDTLTDRVNTILRAIFMAGGKVIDHSIETDRSGSSLIVKMVYTLPKGVPLVRE